MTSETLHLLAACKSGLESIVARELRDLGYDAKPTTPGRVLFEGDIDAIARANMWLRTADRVLVRVATFKATDFGELFDRTNVQAWERWLPRDAAFPVKGRSVRSQLASAPACQKIVKKAIVERLLTAHHTKVLPETGVEFVIEVAIDHDDVSLCIDTTGVSLHKRGYRTLVGPAPIAETLGAALVLLSPWEISQPFIDPFCGSGTICIEAAMIARNIAPGRMRAFSADQWPTLEKSIWGRARAEATNAESRDVRTDILGTDLDPEAVRIATIHAQNAGVGNNTRFDRRPFIDLRAARDNGWLITNPPYGERLGDTAEVDDLYQSMPEVLNRIPTWGIGIITPWERFERLMGREADRRRKLHNASLECVYYQFGPVASDQQRFRLDRTATKPQRTAPVPTEQQVDRAGDIAAKTSRQVEVFANRIANRARHFRKWPERGTDCYRLYDCDIPDVPITVDRYADGLLLTDARGPRSHRSVEQHAAWLHEMGAAAADNVGVPRDHVIVLRKGERPRKDDERRIGVRENSVTLEIDPATGLSLEKRLVRAMVGEAAKGRRVAIIGGDTQAAATHARAGGATAVVVADSVRGAALQGSFSVVLLDVAQLSSDVVDLSWQRVEDGGVLIVVAESGELALEGGVIRDVTGKCEPEDFRGKFGLKVWRAVKRTGS